MNNFCSSQLAFKYANPKFDRDLMIKKDVMCKLTPFFLMEKFHQLASFFLNAQQKCF
jgi:hypothetical protein